MYQHSERLQGTMLLAVVLFFSMVGTTLAKCVAPDEWNGDYYESVYHFEGAGGVHATHITRGGHIDYNYKYKQLNIHQFIDIGTPYSDGQYRDYENTQYIQYSLSNNGHRIIYTVTNGVCRIVTTNDTPFLRYGPPEEAEYRGTTYIGGGEELFADGVKVEIYDTRDDEDDPDVPHYFGAWAPLEDTMNHCIPVTEEFYQAKGRLGYDDVYTGRLTYYNITTALDYSDIPVECTT